MESEMVLHLTRRVSRILLRREVWTQSKNLLASEKQSLRVEAPAVGGYGGLASKRPLPQGNFSNFSENIV